MTPKPIKIVNNEVHSKPLKKIYPTNKTDVHHIDAIWSLDKLDLIIDAFNKFGWKIPLKNENFIILKNSFENFLVTSTRKTKFDRNRQQWRKPKQNN